MTEQWLRIPVECPECRREELAALPVGVVAAALLKGGVIQLYASCHDIYWDARPLEVEQLRQYMAALGVDVRRVSVSSDTRAAEIPQVVNPVASQSSHDGKAAIAGDI